MTRPNLSVVQARKQQALSHFQANRLGEAKVLYDEVCSLDRHDAEAWNMLSAVHGMLGEYGEAERCARQVIALMPEAVGAYNNLANALKLQKKYDQAEDFYRQALVLQPRYAEGYNNLANLLNDTGRMDEAEAAYRSALALEPAYADALNNLGTLLRAKDSFVEAETCYRKALQLRPGFTDAWLNLGLLCQQVLRPDDALGCFNRVVQLQPDHTDALTAIGGIYKEKGMVQEAVSVFRKVVELKPEANQAHYMLANLGAAEVPGESPAEYVVSLFDAYAESFDEHLVERLKYETPQALFDAVKNYLPAAPVRVIDLGCGTGLCGIYLRAVATSMVGVDLSPKMLEKARERQIYDELIESDLTTGLARADGRFGLIMAADVFVYIGDLAGTFEACAQALEPAGIFAFSIESAGSEATYLLRHSGRYAHSAAYIDALGERFGLSKMFNKTVVVREELLQPVWGEIYVFRGPE